MLQKEVAALIKSVSPLGELDLSDRKLSILPSPLSTADNSSYFFRISSIDLRDNELFEINAAFCLSLPQLRVLDLRHNRIKTITEKINLLAHLRVLRLDFKRTKMPTHSENI